MEIKNEELFDMVVISNQEYNEYKNFKDRQINAEIFKKMLTKQYKHEYFTLNRKQIFERCECCDVVIKLNSVHNHNKSKTHLLNLMK